MSGTDEVSGDHERSVKDALDVTSALGQRLLHLESDVDPAELVRELAEAQQELQVAWELVQPEYGDVRGILDQQRADHWWQRKLIATLPIAVLETELDGRIVWANNAAAAMLDRGVLRLVRTRIHKFLHADDHSSVDALLAEHETDPAAEATSRAVLRLASDRVSAVEITTTVRREHDSDRVVLTWVLEPKSERAESGVDESLVAHTFTEICMLPLRSGSLQELLSQVARLCEDVVTEDSSVSVTIGAPADPTHLASSTEFAQQIDAAQMAADEGPCQEAWENREIVYSNDALADERWPRFIAKASDTELRSTVSAPIHVGDEILGVLNIYSRRVDAFSASGMKVVKLLADAAGAVMHHLDEEKQLRELTRQLEEAMRSREIIEQAKGILMVQYRCTAEDAFARLARVSQNRNIRLREVAQMVIDTVTRG